MIRRESKLPLKTVLRLSGLFLAIVMFYFVYQNFSGSYQELSQSVKNINIALFLIASLMYSISFIFMAYLWMYIQYDSQENIGKLDYIDIFITSAFARYIPGGIWNIVGKTVWCIRRGASPCRTSGAICVEYLFQIMSSLFFLLFFLPFIFRSSIIAGFAVLVCGISTLVFLPFFIRLGFKLLRMFFKSQSEYSLSNTAIYGLFIGYIIMWFSVGMGLAVLCISIGGSSPAAAIHLGVAYPVAWVAGFLSPTPNGLGVREYVLQFFGTGTLDAAQLIVLLVGARCWTIAGEIFAFIGIKLLQTTQVFYRINCPQEQDASAERVLFVSTKNRDYLRNTQEIKLLNNSGRRVRLIAGSSRSYFARLIYVYWHLSVIFTGKIDHFFCGFSPQLVLPFWYWKFRNKKITIDFFISLYDTFISDRKIFRRGSLVAHLLYRLDVLTLRLADEIICDTKAHSYYFIRFFKADRNKVKVLYLEADKTYYDPSLYPKYDYDGKILNVLYFGSILPLQGVEVIIDAILLLKKRKDIRFVIIGPLKKMQKKQLAFANAVTFDYLSQRELAFEISRADLCLAGHFNAEIGKAARTIPGKAYIYRSMNKPIILGDTPANHELFESNQGEIIFCPRGDSVSLADRIVKFKEKLQIKKEMDIV